MSNNYYNYENITQIHLETTQLCQAACPMCDRNINGGDVNPYLKNKSLTLDNIKFLFPKSFLHQLNNIYFCGNHGDPIFAPECLEMFEYMRSNNKYLKLGLTTNGGARKPEWWSELAKLDVHVNFSVDGLEDTNHIYRQGVVWKNVEENIDAFTSAGGKGDWTFLVFNYNEHQVEQAERYSKLLGINKFIVKKSGRYITSRLEKKNEHQAVFRKGLGALLSKPTKLKYRNKELEKDIDLNESLASLNIVPKCIQKKEIYISAEGFVFPCCWTAGQMYKWYHEPEASEIWKYIKGYNINALDSSIKHVMESGFFENLEKSWKGEDKLKVCAVKCNNKFDLYTAQWN